MRIFIFSTVFSPKVGGLERRTETLAREWIRLGHEVVVATTTPGPEDGFPFPVIRSGSFATFCRWARWCDVHLQLNVSLKYTPKAAVAGPSAIVISHGGDYAGPYARAKRFLAGRIQGIACSDYIQERVPNSVTICNCYDDATYRSNRVWSERPHDLAFLGRLVSDKGCDTLIEALGLLGARGLRPTLSIIGDGNDRPKLEAMVERLGLHSRVSFSGSLGPPGIADMLNEHRFLIVPSRWEEPFGTVALEGLGCRCVPIVSCRGGLIEAIGPHGYTFENGDTHELARLLEHVLTKPREALAKLEGVEAHLSNFTARRVAERYIELFEMLRR